MEVCSGAIAVAFSFSRGHLWNGRNHSQLGTAPKLVKLAIFGFPDVAHRSLSKSASELRQRYATAMATLTTLLATQTSAGALPPSE